MSRVSLVAELRLARRKKSLELGFEVHKAYEKSQNYGLGPGGGFCTSEALFSGHVCMKPLGHRGSCLYTDFRCVWRWDKWAVQRRRFVFELTGKDIA